MLRGYVRVAAVIGLAACRSDPPARERGPTDHPDPQDLDNDGHPAGADCDDTDALVHPGAYDDCNGIDDDCSGAPDDDPSAWPSGYADQDRDGYGEDGVRVPSDACVLAEVLAPEDGDCDDADPAVHPHALELCNGVDDDCDPLTVEVAERNGSAFPSIQQAVDASSDGDVITLCDGTFGESVGVSADIVLTSQNGASVTVLDGGGARPPIRVTDGAVVEVAGLTIRNGWNPGAGGAIDASGGGRLTVTDCVFEGNTAGEIGGAISATELVVTGSTFSSNATPDGAGGAIDAGPGSTSVSSASFDGNHASTGGAIFVVGGEVDLTDCVFSGNTAAGWSGALDATDASLTMIRTTFTGNSAHYSGAITAVGGDHTADADTVFEDNRSVAIAGGVYVASIADPPMTWSGGKFRRNHSDGAGGGLVALVNAPGGAGGLTVSGVVVEGNDGTDGGGVMLSGPSMVLTDAVLSGNTTATYGGGAYVPSGDVRLIRVDLFDNEAQRGGALYVGEASTTAEDCRLTGNVAVLSGGAVQLDFLAGTVTSVASDLGVDADDNAPDDVRFAGNATPFQYGEDASFTCDAALDVCL